LGWLGKSALEAVGGDLRRSARACLDSSGAEPFNRRRYSDLSSVERGRWHERAGDLLAAEGVPAEELIPHLLASLPDRNPVIVGLVPSAANASINDRSRNGLPPLISWQARQ
jgi:hypothetical protein